MNRQWNKIKNPETDTHVYGNIVKNKVPFQINGGKLDSSIHGIETSR